MGITDYSGIQALSRTSYAKFQNSQALNHHTCFPGLPSTLKNGKNFQRLSRKSGYPDIVS